MLSIGEFSKICKVSTKTLRYYEEIGLLYPAQINTENGYRYYNIEQLETMLFINRLKTYSISLDDIKEIIECKDERDEILYKKLASKKKELMKHIVSTQSILKQMEMDIELLNKGKPIMSYMKEINVSLVELPKMYLISTRKMVHKGEFPDEYKSCFGELFIKIKEAKLTIQASPMVLFHGDEFTTDGFDTEFAIPIIESEAATRCFAPGLCVKTELKGSYSMLTSVYAKQRKWAEENDYVNCGPLFEQYIVDPKDVDSEEDLITHVYYQVKKL